MEKRPFPPAARPAFAGLRAIRSTPELLAGDSSGVTRSITSSSNRTTRLRRVRNTARNDARDLAEIALMRPRAAAHRRCSFHAVRRPGPRARRRPTTAGPVVEAVRKRGTGFSYARCVREKFRRTTPSHCSRAGGRSCCQNSRLARPVATDSSIILSPSRASDRDRDRRYGDDRSAPPRAPPRRTCEQSVPLSRQMRMMSAALPRFAMDVELVDAHVHRLRADSRSGSRTSFDASR